MVSATLMQEVVGGDGLVFDRIDRIEGGKERGRRGNHAESAEGKGKLRLVARLR